MEVANSDTKSALLRFYSEKLENNSEKILEVTQIFKAHNIPNFTKELIENYTSKAFESLDNLTISEKAKQNLKDFGNNLMSRTV